MLAILEDFCCSAALSCLTLCDLMDCSMPGVPVFHYLLELAQTHVYRVGHAIQLTYLFLAALGLGAVCRLSLVAVSRGYSLVGVHRLLIAVAPLVVEHGL